MSAAPLLCAGHSIGEVARGHGDEGPAGADLASAPTA
jgi:hypothetical protein